MLIEAQEHKDGFISTYPPSRVDSRYVAPNANLPFCTYSQCDWWGYVAKGVAFSISQPYEDLSLGYNFVPYSLPCFFSEQRNSN